MGGEGEGTHCITETDILLEFLFNLVSQDALLAVEHERRAEVE